MMALTIDEVNKALQIRTNGKMTGIGKYLLNFLEFATKERSNYAFILYGNQHTSLDYKAPNLTLKIIPEMATIWWDQGTLPSLIKKDRIDIFFSIYQGPCLCSLSLCHNNP
ncbi:MAG TPA: hypothetical protein EYP21_05070 [Syntrophaceae bacterium]|nr:hypothetical protein [Syntrophaceae bacterium]